MWQFRISLGILLVAVCALAGCALYWSIDRLKKINICSYTKLDFIFSTFSITIVTFLEIMVCTEMGDFLDTLMPAFSIFMIVSIILMIISIIINIISIIKCRR